MRNVSKKVEKKIKAYFAKKKNGSTDIKSGSKEPK